MRAKITHPALQESWYPSSGPHTPVAHTLHATPSPQPKVPLFFIVVLSASKFYPLLAFSVCISVSVSVHLCVCNAG